MQYQDISTELTEKIKIIDRILTHADISQLNEFIEAQQVFSIIKNTQQPDENLIQNLLKTTTFLYDNYYKLLTIVDLLHTSLSKLTSVIEQLQGDLYSPELYTVRTDLETIRRFIGK